MQSILVFNNMNDLVYWKWNHLFVKHVLGLATGQGLIEADAGEGEYTGELNPDIVIQIFSPIITSQRIMTCQFGNSYTSVECQDGTNIVFDEFVGYLLVHIGTDSICWMQNSLATCISIIKYFCGPDLSLLKQSRYRSGVNLTLSSALRLSTRSQAALLGATEPLTGAPEHAAAALAAARASLAALPNSAKAHHAAIFVGSSILALYSCRGVEDLSPSDVYFLGMLCSGAQDEWTRRPPSTPNSRSASPSEEELDDSFDCEDIGQTMSYTIILSSGTALDVHLRRLARATTLVMCCGLPPASSRIAAGMLALAGVQAPLSQRDPEALRPALAALDSTMKKALDALKKLKNQAESPQRKLQTQFDSLRRCATLIGKNNEAWLALEGAAGALSVGLRAALQLACRGFIPADVDLRPAAMMAHDTPMLKNALVTTPGMSKYVEEFPGLVHFLHVDRTNNRLTAPALPDCSHMLSRKKIWQMVERGMVDVHAGHLAAMWKDGALHYAHLLWWEEAGGAPLKPRPPPATAMPAHNLTPHDYFTKLTAACFPGSGASRVRCYELYAVHLGLLPAGTALAHVRRLAATVGDLRAAPHPASLL